MAAIDGGVRSWLAGCFCYALAAWSGADGRAVGADPAPEAAARAALATFKLPPGMKAELFAVEPQLGNPVAIAVDEQGRVFVAEEYRFNRGTEENRTRPFLLEDDLQITTLDDRLAMFQKHAGRFEGGMAWFSKYSDQLRLLEDRDGDGRAERASVFADGFNGPLDGLAAGVLAHEGDVYFTCIPHLWRLRDTDGDGKADRRESLLTGFGVNAAFLGHDLHGLVWGPDGRLYFSIGDRGFHVRTKEGSVVQGARNGAVFRCEPDGSRLEVLHRGLRNPQELAFNDRGDLFADDNNCDKGDRSRLVYVVEGGDSGWNMAYQTLPAPYLTGPWHAENLWHLADPRQPAWIVPPVGHLGAGPSGFVYYPGVGLDDRYQDRFLMANYTGGGQIDAFGVRPQGAGFTVVDYHVFCTPVRATDVEFGYDGKLYVSEFPHLDWSGAGQAGRLFTMFDPQRIQSPVVEQTKRLFREGFRDRGADELLTLFAHPDLRVRQRAQFALAARGAESIAPLTQKLTSAATLRERLHALWGLWQIARRDPQAIAPIVARLDDPDAELRAQAAKVSGDVGATSAASRLVELLEDGEPRVRFFAAQALGRMRRAEAVEPLFALVEREADRDPYLRHAAATALIRIGDGDAIAARANHPSDAVRLAAIVALRGLSDKRLARFLDDPQTRLVVEAARAVHDTGLDDLLPEVAKRLSRARGDATAEPLARRALHAHLRAGGAENVRAVAAVATDAAWSTTVRAEALAVLADWSKPGPRDRVTGFWRPSPPRDPEIVKRALEPLAPELLARSDGELQAAAVQLVAKLDIRTDDSTFTAWAADAAKPTATRVASLRVLAGRKSSALRPSLDKALTDASPVVRAEARDLLARVDRPAALTLLRTTLDAPTAATVERQRALATAASLDDPDARALVEAWVERLAAGRTPAELHWDVVEAGRKLKSPAVDTTLDRFQASAPGAEPHKKFAVSLYGGDAERGRAVFFGSAVAQCVRCHRAGGEGGTAGPDLAGVAARVKREELLQSLLAPSAKIAAGFATITVVLDSGKVVAGVLKSETPERLTIETPDGRRVEVATSEVDERTEPTSAMPTVERALTPGEVRDLVEFLSTLK